MKYKSEDWNNILTFFKNKPDGTKLPYSMRWDARALQYIPRPKYPNASKDYQSTHSFIKIGGEVYQLAQGKNPNAVLGRGTYAKCKVIENQQGSISVAKIETKNSSNQECEYQILTDLNLSKGKCQRPDKTKFYTQMPYLGTPLSQLLEQSPILCNQKMPLSGARANSVYLYLKSEQIECLFTDEMLILRKITLTPENLGQHHQALLQQLKSPSLNFFTMKPFEPNFPYILLERRPEDDEIKENTLTLYVNKGGLRIAFIDHLGQVKRKLLHDYAFSKPNDNYVYVVSADKPANKDLLPNHFYIYLSDGALSCAYKSQTNVNRFKISKNEPFYLLIKEIFYEAQHELRSQYLADETLATSVYKAIGKVLRPLDEEQRLEIAIDLCLELAYLHEGHRSLSGTSYAHGDIKAENIVIDSNSKVHLIDFGFAKPNPSNLMKKDLTITGTPMCLPYINGVSDEISFGQLDLLALKRVLFLPLSYYSFRGYTTSDAMEQKSFSLLTLSQLNQYQLAPYIDTSSTLEENNYCINQPLSARTLAAILLVAQQGLNLDYNELIHDKARCLEITSAYAKNKASAYLKNHSQNDAAEEKHVEHGRGFGL